jgi:tetratricopeptide (TPR) repeat protein
MNGLSTQYVFRTLILIGLLFSGATATGQDNKTVLGPENPDLYHGANALLAGNGEEGVRLTLLGLQNAMASRERNTAMSNLCAGYIMLDQLEVALTYCDKVLADNDRNWRAYSNRALAYVKLGRFEEAEQDLQKAEAIVENARTVKAVRSMLLDATNPVVPEIIMDDRRQPLDQEDE